MRVRASGGLALAVVLLLSGCTKRPSTFPNAPVIWISVDTVRADHLPAYGYRGVATPNLDRLRRDSILYANAYSHVPLTLPSHATLLTGLLPFENGVRDNIGFRLTRSHATLAAILRRQGYATGAAVSSYVLRRDRGLAEGFDFYDDAFGAADPDERAGDQTRERLETWIGSVRGKPLFALLHLYEPHTPYEPPQPFRSRYTAAPYDGEIAAADAVVGRFVDRLKETNLYDRSIIVFLSDHGEGLGEHGEDEHGVLLYRESMHIPLFLKLPGSKESGRTVVAPVGLVDLLPTTLALLRLPIPASLSGSSLFDPRAASGERRIYGETLYPRLQLGWSDLASLTDARYRYIDAPRPELFDLQADPGERENLAPAAPPAFRRMRAELSGWRNRSPERPESSTSEELGRLGSLGYIGAARPAGKEALPDPKDRLETLRKYKRLFAFFYARKDADAIPLAKEVLREDPKILSVWRMLAESLARTSSSEEATRVLEEGIRQAGEGSVGEELSQSFARLATLLERSGQTGKAEGVLRESIRKGLATQDIHRQLSRILLRSGRSPEAEALLSAYSGNGDPETLDLLGLALVESGQLSAARSAFLRALVAGAPGSSVFFHLGSLSLREKDPAGAKEWFVKALAVDPRAANVLASLGVAQVQLGEEAGALDSWRKALAVDPRQYDALFNLAILAGRTGRHEEARQRLERFLATATADRYARNRAEARKLLRSIEKRGS